MLRPAGCILAIASAVSLSACAREAADPIMSLPVIQSSTTSSTTMPPPSTWLEYEIKKFDTLGKIAAWCGVTQQAILQFNPRLKDPNTIPFGTKINIPNPTIVDPAFCVGTTVTR